MRLPHLFLPLLILLHARTVLACIRYTALFPFSEMLPFEASITDNNVTTCWISRTYAEHNRRQQAALFAPGERQREDMVTWGFKRWDFECLEGFEGWANVGVRTMGYRRKGEKNIRGWVADMREDVWGEKWVYGKTVECDVKKDEPGKKKEQPAKKKEDAPKGTDRDSEKGKGGDLKVQEENKKKEEAKKKEDSKVKEEKKKEELRVQEENKKKEDAKRKYDEKKTKEAKQREDLKRKLEQRKQDQLRWEAEMRKME